MPIFEYQCLECQEVFETLQLSRESSEDTQCPGCGSERAEKLVSAFATSGGGDSLSGAGCGPTGGSGFR
jgi:putative FmdB family regulatory protein